LQAQPAAGACRLGAASRPRAESGLLRRLQEACGAARRGRDATAQKPKCAQTAAHAAAPAPQPLTPEELADAKAAIEGLVEKGQTLNLKTQARSESACARSAPRGTLNALHRRPQVKPEIIAGLVVEIGDKYLVRANAPRFG
jgi:hypothetical protein